MQQDDVVAFLDLADRLGVTVWLDGGWGVEACLGRQTRPHGDIDVVVQADELAVLVEALRGNGYADVPRDDTCAWNVVLGDGSGREVDVHVTIDPRGDGVYGPVENGEPYPAQALTGTGVVAGRPVRCISPQWLIRFRTGYAVDETDWADVRALCAQFDLPVPADYSRWL